MTLDEVKELKKSLAKAFPAARSTHLHEAIAAGLGFGTYAGLLAAFKGTHPENKQVPASMDAVLFDARLRALSKGTANAHV